MTLSFLRPKRLSAALVAASAFLVPSAQAMKLPVHLQPRDYRRPVDSYRPSRAAHLQPGVYPATSPPSGGNPSRSPTPRRRFRQDIVPSHLELTRSDKVWQKEVASGHFVGLAHEVLDRGMDAIELGEKHKHLPRNPRVFDYYKKVNRAIHDRSYTPESKRFTPPSWKISGTSASRSRRSSSISHPVLGWLDARKDKIGEKPEKSSRKIHKSPLSKTDFGSKAQSILEHYKSKYPKDFHAMEEVEYRRHRDERMKEVRKQEVSVRSNHWIGSRMRKSDDGRTLSRAINGHWIQGSSMARTHSSWTSDCYHPWVKDLIDEKYTLTGPCFPSAQQDIAIAEFDKKMERLCRTCVKPSRPEVFFHEAFRILMPTEDKTALPPSNALITARNVRVDEHLNRLSAESPELRKLMEDALGKHVDLGSNVTRRAQDAILTELREELAKLRR